MKRACDLSSASGCHSYAVGLIEGTHVGRDVPRGRDLMRRTCREGYAPACREACGWDKEVCVELCRRDPKETAACAAAKQ